MKQVLLLVAGMTPQIVTETLYALTQQRHEAIDEIRIITTLDGRDRLLPSLLDPQQGKFFAFCGDYGIDPSRIQFDETSIALLRTPDGRTLADIRTPEENEWAGDQICEIVRGLAADANVRIHASAAGGRKTMSIYLTAAMQLFGRVDDTLSHVLVSEEFETHPEFYYIPPIPQTLRMRDGREISTSSARIYLAPIPFIRLQGSSPERWRDRERSYNVLVRQAQEDLDLLNSTHDLVIDLKRGRITASVYSVRLPPREFLIYTLFAAFRRDGRGNNGFVALPDVRREDVAAAFGLISGARGKNLSLDGYELLAGHDFLPNLISLIDSKNFKDLGAIFTQVNSRIKRRFKAVARLDRFLIATRGGYSASLYGLDVPPERIVIS